MTGSSAHRKRGRAGKAVLVHEVVLKNIIHSLKNGWLYSVHAHILFLLPKMLRKT